MKSWPSLKRPIQAPKQLLVEGRTPEIFFREWVAVLELGNQVEVRDYGSIADLTAYLRVFTARKEFREAVQSVAIVRDAEDQPASSAFKSVCASLGEVKLESPEQLGGFSSGKPRTGVFVLPDCRQPGMLETLCWSALEQDPRLAPQLNCVTAYLACRRAAQAQVHNEAKARVWTFLAGQGLFDPQVGRAAQKSVWDWSSPALADLGAFLKAL